MLLGTCETAATAQREIRCAVIHRIVVRIDYRARGIPPRLTGEVRMATTTHRAFGCRSAAYGRPTQATNREPVHEPSPGPPCAGGHAFAIEAECAYNALQRPSSLA